MEAKDVNGLLKDYPKNWGRWGAEDEVGSLNFLTAEEVLRGIKAIKKGNVFTLGNVIRGGEADPTWPGRRGAELLQTQANQDYLSGRIQPMPGGMKYADCMINTFCHAVTHVDAIGHMWYGDKIYNGYDAKTTMGKMQKASVLPVAEKGIVGRGILLDVARYKGVEYLAKGSQITLQDLLGTAAKQGAPIEKHDILLIRTGLLNTFYTKGRTWFYENFAEPGLTVEKELVEWWHKMEIPFWTTDTTSNEQTPSSLTGGIAPLHGALMTNMGVAMSEVSNFEALAADCAEDRQYTFLYIAAPLKIAGASGAPVNPVCIK